VKLTSFTVEIKLDDFTAPPLFVMLRTVSCLPVRVQSTAAVER